MCLKENDVSGYPMPVNRIAILTALALSAILASASAQPPGMAPPKVVLATPSEGVLAPQSEYKGSVYFKEIAQVAGEVSGKVLEVRFDEGQAVKKGDALVRLDDELLRKDLESARATVARWEAELEDARVRYARSKTLVEEGLGTPEAYDEIRFQVESLGNQLWSARASMERLETLIERYTIKAPFDGVVLERLTDHGEWNPSGGSIALLARDRAYEVAVDVPEEFLRFLGPGVSVPVVVGDDVLTGSVLVIVPRGDIATRTFPVKIAVEREAPLYQGMTAMVRLPIGEETACTLVPRDAVLRDRGDEFIFTLEGGDTARRHAVDVLGFRGLQAGIATDSIGVDARVIVKGHERLRDGQRVEVVPAVSDTAAGPHTDD